MLRLTDDLRRGFKIGDTIYKVDLAYDNVLRFYELLDDDHFSAIEKAQTAFEMFFGFAPGPDDDEYVAGAFEGIAKYLSEDPYEDTNANVTDLAGNDFAPTKYYSFSQDAGAIYASFREQYGINLIEEQGKLQWDEFKALFAGLGPKTYFQRIVSIRQADPNDYEGKEQIELIEAQNRYALANSHTEETVQAQLAGFADALKGWAQS